uniref:Bacterial surface antigen (D15) domain-containing protein n=1 Tax=Paramoeba aestuarina TaxID=180227 RepID=A0A7S4JZA9_9EUKA
MGDHFSEHFEEIFDEEVLIDDILISGNTRTKTDFLVDQLADLVGQKLPMTEIFAKAHERGVNLHRLGFFSNVDINVNKAPDSEAPKNGPLPCVLHYTVKDKPGMFRGWLGIKGSMDDVSVPILYANISAPNLLGRGEELQTDIGVKIPGFSLAGEISLKKPKYRAGKLSKETVCNTYSTTTDNMDTCGFSADVFGAQLSSTYFYSMDSLFGGVFGEKGREKEREEIEEQESVGEVAEDALAAMGLKNSGKVGWSSTYTMSYDCRKITPAKECSMRVRGWAGNSVKSSFGHKLKMDTRDNALAPTTGSYFELSSELAGLGGDVAFFKSQVSCQNHFPLPFFGMALNFAVRAGAILPLGGSNFIKMRNESCLDRFYLGGMNSTRGFLNRGAGPREKGNALGGRYMLESYSGLTVPLPEPFPGFVQLHGFIDAGAVADHHERLRDQLRLVGGGGLVVTGMGCRIEVNLVHNFNPLGFKNDQFRGYELRFSPSFM